MGTVCTFQGISANREIEKLNVAGEGGQSSCCFLDIKRILNVQKKRLIQDLLCIFYLNSLIYLFFAMFI